MQELLRNQIALALIVFVVIAVGAYVRPPFIVIDYYVKNNACTYTILKGYWSDAGTFESLIRASNLVREKESVEESFWDDTDDFSQTFKFPSKQDDKDVIIEKLSQLTKKQSEILDYLSKK